MGAAGAEGAAGQANVKNQKRGGLVVDEIHRFFT